MTRLLGILLLACALALPARAEDKASAETMQAARELAAIMTGDVVEQLSRAMTAQIWPTIEQQVAGKVDAATIADMRTAFEQTLTKFTGEVMKNAPDLRMAAIMSGWRGRSSRMAVMPSGLTPLALARLWMFSSAGASRSITPLG